MNWRPSVSKKRFDRLSAQYARTRSANAPAARPRPSTVTVFLAGDRDGPRRPGPEHIRRFDVLAGELGGERLGPGEMYRGELAVAYRFADATVAGRFKGRALDAGATVL